MALTLFGVTDDYEEGAIYFRTGDNSNDSLDVNVPILFVGRNEIPLFGEIPRFYCFSNDD